jgi:hypothetical protein
LMTDARRGEASCSEEATLDSEMDDFVGLDIFSLSFKQRFTDRRRWCRRLIFKQRNEGPGGAAHGSGLALPDPDRTRRLLGLRTWSECEFLFNYGYVSPHGASNANGFGGV